MGGKQKTTVQTLKGELLMKEIDFRKTTTTRLRLVVRTETVGKRNKRGKQMSQILLGSRKQP